MKKSKLLKKLMKKYHIKEGDHITIDLIDKILSKENMSITDFKCLFQISSHTMNRLKNGKQNYTRLKFNRYDGIKDRKLLRKGKINYEEFINFKNKINVKTYTLIRTLGISPYTYKKMLKDKTYEAIVKDVKAKHIVDLIKLDFKYLKKKSGYISVRKIQKICKEMHITIEQFAKYYGSTIKHYKFNLMILEKSSKGFWFSLDTKIPDKFITTYHNKLIYKLKKVVTKVSIIIGSNSYNEDLVQDAMGELYAKCGNIVRDFYFDTKILFNILMAKAKYFMLSIYRKKYKEKNTISYDSFKENNMNFFRDFRFDPQELFN